MKLREVPYDFSINILEEKLREYKPRNILIQSANGLKKYIPLLVEYIGKILPQSNILVSDSPTYGGCDVAEQEAILVNADVVIHVGHAKYHEPKVNVIFIEARSKLEVNNNVLSSLVSLIENRGIKSVSIVSTIQHIHEIVKVKILKSALADKKAKEVASEVAEKTEASLVEVRGHTFILYRRKKRKK